MSLKINNTAVFKQNGITLGVSQVWIDLQVILPADPTQDGTVKFKVYTDSTRDIELKNIDDLQAISDLDLAALVTSDYWTDINAGSVHDAVIAELIARDANWTGKITKELPE